MTINTNSIVKTAVFMMISLILNACALTTSSPINTIPPDRLTPVVDGWNKDGDRIECNTIAELSQQINGAAPFYIERGAKKIIFQDYISKDKKIINLEIYQMGRNSQAATLFNDVFVEKPSFIKDIGENARISNYLVGAYSIDFIVDTYYSKITILEKTPESKREVEKFARVLSGNMTGR